MSRRRYSKNAAHKLSNLLYKDSFGGNNTMPYGERFHKVRKTSQQTLLYLGHAIAKWNDRFYTSERGDTQTTNAAIPKITIDSYDDKKSASTLDEGWQSGYRWICPTVVTADETEAVGEYTQNPDVHISRLTGLGPEIDKYFTFELTSAQMAALVPLIEINKIEYTMEYIGGKPTGRVDRTVPPFRRPIVFENAVTQNEFEILIESGGNVGSSGIESFRWSLKGVNPAEVDTNIEAELKIYFNNVGVFQKHLDAIAQGNPSSQELLGSFVDLITFAPPSLPGTDLPCLETYNPNYFEIEVRVGWIIEEAFGSDTLAIAMGEKALFTEEQVQYIKNQTQSLYLTLTDHKFDFEEDGSATLDARYRARTTLVGEQFDLLLAAAPENVAERAAFDQSPSGRIRIAQDRIRQHERDFGDVEDPTEAQKEAMEADQALLRQALKDNYQSIIERLLDNVYEAFVPNKLLLNGVKSGSGVPDDTSEYEGTLSWDDLFEIAMETNTRPTAQSTGWWGSTQTAHDQQQNVDFEIGVLDQITAAYDAATAGSSPITVRRKTSSRLDVDAVVEATLDVDDDLSDNDYARPGPPRVGLRDPELLAAEAGQTEIRATTAHGNHTGTSTINFFYLGDILEVLLGTGALMTEIAASNFGVMTTDFRYKNYLKMLKLIKVASDQHSFEFKWQQRTVSTEALRCNRGAFTLEMMNDVYSAMNMANIPINLELFLDWFTAQVVANERESYYLEDFLNDLFNGMVKPILNDQGILGVPVSQPSMLNLNIDTRKDIPFFQATQPPGTSTKIGYDFNLGSSTADDYTTVQSRDPTESIENCSYINFVDQYEELARVAVGSASNRKRFPVFPYAQKSLVSELGSGDPIPFTGATVKILGIMTDLGNMDGNYARNLLHGVKNFIVGLDKGVIKSVSFSRVDQPYLRESRTAVSKNFGVGQLRELYHVDMVLYGNNLLKPGMMIYVEPNSLIFGRPTQENSVARRLGLGGYHLVVDISNSISKDGWETEVRALHMAMPAETDRP
jgi:hypothetical protein